MTFLIFHFDVSQYQKVPSARFHSWTDLSLFVPPVHSPFTHPSIFHDPNPCNQAAQSLLISLCASRLSQSLACFSLCLIPVQLSLDFTRSLILSEMQDTMCRVWPLLRCPRHISCILHEITTKPPRFSSDSLRFQ